MPAPPQHANADRTRFAALVALKRAEQAKSRLDSIPDPLRRRLAWTMALDTLRALSDVLPVIVISNQPGLDARLRAERIPARVLGESQLLGVNAALRHGERTALAAGFDGVLAAVGDLPALRAESVRTVLAAAREHQRAFVADAAGIGTTMLTAVGTGLEPRFQGRSAAAHRMSGAVSLGAAEIGPVADARRDVDDEVDLADAAGLGLGPATAQLFEGTSLGRYAVITIATQLPDGSATAVASCGYRVHVPATVASQFRRLAPGQRLHAVLAGRDTALSAWIY